MVLSSVYCTIGNKRNDQLFFYGALNKVRIVKPIAVMLPIFLTFFMLIPCNAEDQKERGSVKPVNVENLYIAGIRLGMSPQEAITAIKSYLNVDENKLAIDNYGRSQFLNNGQTEFINRISYYNGAESIRVELHVSPPVDISNPVKVELVEYGLSNKDEHNLPKNKRSLYQAALSKFGPPSIIENELFGGEQYYWASEINNASNPGETPRYSASLKKPYILYDGGSLVLFDPTANQRRIDEENKRAKKKPRI